MTEAAVTSDGTRALRRARAAAVEPVGSGSVVRGHDRTIHRYPVRPDMAAAACWLQILRRVDRVEIGRPGASHCCRVSGVGHRRPVSRPVSLATALGLGALGVPLVVESGGR